MKKSWWKKFRSKKEVLENEPTIFFKDSILGRVFRGFSAEVDVFPERFENVDIYINQLIARESDSLMLYGKLFRSLLVLNSIALLCMQGVITEHKIFGYVFSNIPASSGILCLLIGVTLFAFCVNNLDIILYGIIRREIVRRRYHGTDLENIATAHLKSGGIWLDLISPRSVGYRSSTNQHFLLRFLSSMFISFTAIILLASLFSLGSIFSFVLKNYDWLSYLGVISSAGLLIGIMGILIFFFVQFIPCKFSAPIILQDSKKN